MVEAVGLFGKMQGSVSTLQLKQANSTTQGCVDWSIVVALQMSVFNLQLMAARRPASSECSSRVSLAWIGSPGVCGWGYILFEIFKGEAGCAPESARRH